MNINTITLHPFAGVKNKSFRFEAGLNVVCGPNDIGKSTLFRAIESVFFLDVKLKSNSLDGMLLKHFIPIGGDHAAVTIAFECEGQPYSLHKTWGAGARCSLELPGGAVLNAQDKVNETLQRILPASAATFKHVLLAGQNKLDQTIAELKKNKDSLHSLGDVLRLSMNQNSGVSVDRLKAMLQEKLRSAFDRWDVRAQGPEGGRGLERPWAIPGSILASWYEREKLKRQRDEAQELERLLGETASLLSEKLARQAELRTFIKEHEHIVEALKQKSNLEIFAANAKNEVKKISADFSSWTKAENWASIIEPEMKRLENVVENLRREQTEARNALARAIFVERFEGIQKERKELETLRTARSQLPVITGDEVETLRAALHRSERVRASLSASRLALKFTAKAGATLVIQKDFDPVAEHALQAGESLELQAGGRICIGSASFEMAMNSGDGKIDELGEALRAADQEAAAILKTHAIESLAEAIAMQSNYDLTSRRLEASERSVKALLGSDRYEDLKAQYQAAQTVVGSRDPAVIDREFAEASSELGKKKTEFTVAHAEVKRLKQVYQTDSEEPLLLLMSEKSAEEKRLLAELQSLPVLPLAFSEPSALLSQFKRAKDGLQNLSDDIPPLSAELADIKARLPEQTAQDFDRQHRDADQLFHKNLRRGLALQRVSAAVEQIESQNQNIYHALQAQLEQNVAQISCGQYAKASMDHSLPTDFVRRDGAPIPFEWLSGGTKDSFALCLRLSMAQYFLSKRSGFILLDDPMVSMDSDRQKVAAELMRSFSADNQLVVFTCHTGHADILEGNRVLL